MNLRAESVSAVEDLLEGIPSKNTRKNYRNRIKRFKAWYGNSITKLIKDPEAIRIVEKFFVHLEQSHPQNTCRNWTNSVIQFLKFNRVDVRPRRAPGIYKTSLSIKTGIHGRTKPRTAIIQAFHKPNSNSGISNTISPPCCSLI